MTDTDVHARVYMHKDDISTVVECMIDQGDVKLVLTGMPTGYEWKWIVDHVRTYHPGAPIEIVVDHYEHGTCIVKDDFNVRSA